MTQRSISMAFCFHFVWSLSLDEKKHYTALVVCILIKCELSDNDSLATVFERTEPKAHPDIPNSVLRAAMSSQHLERERDTFHLVFRHKEASSAKVQHCLCSRTQQFILRSGRLFASCTACLFFPHHKTRSNRGTYGKIYHLKSTWGPQMRSCVSALLVLML